MPPNLSLASVDDIHEVEDDWEAAWPEDGRGELGPLDAQAVAEKEKGTWTGYWRSSEQYPRLDWPESLGHLLPRLLLGSFLQ